MARVKSTTMRDVLPDLHDRSVFVRRYGDIIRAILVDQGGADQCPESRKQLIRRFAAAAALAEQMEAQVARGKTIDIKDHALLCATMVNVARHLGAEKTTRNLNSPLMNYLELKAQQKGSNETSHRPVTGSV
jgi:hypothetical protein